MARALESQVQFLPLRSAQQEGRRQSIDGRVLRIDLQSAAPPEIHKAALLRNLSSVGREHPAHNRTVLGSNPRGSIAKRHIKERR